MGDMASVMSMLQAGQGKPVGGLLGALPTIGNALSGTIPQSSAVPSSPAIGMPALPKALPGGTQPVSGTSGLPTAPIGTISTPGAGGGTISLNPVPTAPPINGGDFNSVYGVDTGSAVTNLLNSENGGTASTTAQQIIQANAPNVAKGSADLNTALAAGGISPSSSVSAIENANYMGQVQQQNLAEEATVGLSEQQMQQQLLESLLPTQQQRQTDSSGWSIFNDILEAL